MNSQQFLTVTKWQNETFEKATSLSKIAHLKREVKELKKDLKTNSPAKRLEFADCFILLFGAAASDGMTYEDIVNCVNEKMEINKSRKWGEPESNGVVSHIKEECKHTSIEEIQGGQIDRCRQCGKTWGGNL